MNEKDFAELAAGAALHALTPADERRLRSAAAEHPERADLVDDDAETAGALAMTTASATPPAYIRSALLAQIAITPQHGATDAVDDAPHDDAPLYVPEDFEATTTDPTTPDAATADADAAPAPVEHLAPRRRRWSRSLLALAACLALVVGVGVGAATLNEYLNRPTAVVALEQIEAAGDAQQASVRLDDGGTATAHWSASTGTAVLVTDGIPSAADGESYELWFVRGDGPVSAGVFDGGDATAVLAGEMHAGDVIAVTVEQEGGSPSGQPTTAPFITIPTV